MWHFDDQSAGRKARPTWQRAVAWLLMASHVGLLPIRGFAQVAVVAPVAGTSTRVYSNPNGVPVVNIAKPNATGLSNNTYTQFNVGPSGLVLNNNPMVAGGGLMAPANSKLAGAMANNPNLTVPAKVILNQVVSASPSVLKGYLEVAGQQAQVVVANPYGIACSGCGFLNTPRVSLTTGTPVLNGNGALTGYQVGGGTISVTGGGLDASTVGMLELVSRAVSIQAPVTGQAVTVVTGTGSYDVTSQALTPVTVSDGAPAVAIDTAALGGMYAQTIRLVSTEAGVGVRMQGPVSAGGGDLTLQAGGPVRVQAPMSATGNVSLSSTASGSGALSLSGANVIAGGNVALSANQGEVALAGGQLQAINGTLSMTGQTLSDTASGATAGGNNTRDASGGITLSATGAGVLSGVNYAAGQALSVSANDVMLSGGTVLSSEASSASLNAAHVLALGNATLVASGDVNLTAGAGGVQYAGDAKQGQAIESRAGNVMLMSGGGVTNSGTVLTTSGALVLKSAGPVTNSGTLSSGMDLRISDAQGGGTEAVVNSGKVVAAGGLSVQGASIANSGGLQGGSQGEVSTAGALTNSGTLVLSTTTGAHGGTDTVQAGTLTNTPGGAIWSNQGLTVSSGTALENGGSLGAEGGLQVNASSVTNEAGASLGSRGRDATVTADTVRNAGTMTAQGNLAVQGTTLTNEANGVLQGNGLSITASSVDNRGQITGGTQAATMTVSGTLTNEAGAVLTMNRGSGATGTVSAGTLNNAGTLQAGGDLTVRSGALTDTGTFNVLGRLTLADQQGQANERVQIGSAGQLEAGTLNAQMSALLLNDGALLQTQGATTLTAGTLTQGGQHARMLLGLSGQDSVLTLGSGLDNVGLVFSGGGLTVNAPSIVNETTGGIAALGALTLKTAGSVTNRGELYSHTALNVNAGSFTNVGTLNGALGQVDSDGTIAITAPVVTNESEINAAGNITVTAKTFTNEVAGGDTRQWAVSPEATVSNVSYHDAWGTVSQIAQVLGQQMGCTGSTNCMVGQNGAQTGYVVDYSDIVNHWTRTFYQSVITDKQYYAGGTPTYQPKLVSAGTLTIQGFDSGQNVGAVMSGNTVTLKGNAGATFTNDANALQQLTYTTTWDNKSHSWCTFIAVCWNDTYTENMQISQAYATLNPGLAGIYANTLNGSGFNLVNLGSPWQAAGQGMSTPGAANTGLQATTNAGGGNLGASSVAGVGSLKPVSLGATGVAGVGSLVVDGVTVSLPTNPNGLYVMSAGAHPTYLIETNPQYLLGEQTGGLTYLIDTVLGTAAEMALLKSVRLLGDPNYELSLVGRELVAQTGVSLEAGYTNEADQYQALMTNASSQAKGLGLKVGTALTASQIAGLKSDIVWPVQAQVDGQTVLVPQVYLVPGAHPGLPSGAVIQAQNVDLTKLGTVTNSGGTLAGTQSLRVQSTGDIDNLGGTIGGGTVSLTSTAGSIYNTTLTQGNAAVGTSLGNVASIGATRALTLDAAQDVVVSGATLSSGGDAWLTAGRDIVLNPVQKSAHELQTATRWGGGQVSSVLTQLALTENAGSQISVAGNLTTQSGRDTTLLGSGVTAGGNVSMAAGGALNVLAADDTATLHTQGFASGFGLNGSLYGMESMSSDTRMSTNVGSVIQARGNASLKAGGTLTVQGSDVSAQGNLGVNAQNVQVLAGQHTMSTTSSEWGWGLLGGTTSTSAVSALAQQQGGLLNAVSSAAVQAQGSAGVSLFASHSHVNSSDESIARGSTLTAGAGLTMTASRDLTAQGAIIQGSAVSLKAGGNVDLLASQDVRSSAAQASSLSVGVTSTQSAQAEVGTQTWLPVGAQAGSIGSMVASFVAQGAGAQANADAGVSGTTILGMTQTQSSSALRQIHNNGTALTSSGGDVSLRAGQDVVLQATTVNAAGNVAMQGSNIRALAAQDVSEFSSQTSTTTAGLYVSHNASVDAAGGGIASVIGANAGGVVSSQGQLGVGLTYSKNTSSQSVNVGTAVVTQITAGGNVSRKASDTLLDQGTQIVAGGDVTQQAQTIESLAAANTYSEEAHSSSLGFTAGLTLGVNAMVQGGGGAGVLSGGNPLRAVPYVQGNAGGMASIGAQIGFQSQNEAMSMQQSQAVVSTIQAAGSVTSTSSGKTTLEGTQVKAGGDVNVTGASVTVAAAANTYSETDRSSSFSAGANVGVGPQAGGMMCPGCGFGIGAGLAVVGNVNVGYSGSNGQSQASQAVVSSLTGGGNVSVKTTAGELTLEGTKVVAGGNVSLASASALNYQAAYDTASGSQNSTRVGVNAGLQVMPGEIGLAPFANGGVQYGGSYGTEESRQAEVGTVSAGGTLTVKTGGDASLTGTQLAAGGKARLDIGGNLSFNAAQNTSQSSTVQAGVDVQTAAVGYLPGTHQTAFQVGGQNLGVNNVTYQQGSLKAGGGTTVQVVGNFSEQVVGNQAPEVDANAVQAQGSKSTTVVNDSHSATQVGLFLANGTSQYTFPVNAAGAHAQEEQAEADAKPVAAHASEPVSGGAGVAEQQGNASRESEAISNGAHVSTNTPDLTVAESATKPSESLLLRGVKAVDPQPVPAPMSEMAESDQGRTDSMELAQQPGTHVVVQLGHNPVVQKAATDYAEAAGAHQMVVSDPRNLDLDALKQQMSNVTPEDQVHVHLVGHEGAASANDKATIINAVHEAVRTRNPESGVASAHDISCNSGTCAPVVQAQLKENHGLDVPVYGHEGAVAVKSGGKVVTAKEGAVGTLGFESSTSDFSGGVDEKPLSPKVDPNAVQAQEKQSSAKLAEGKHASQHGHAATAPELAGHAQDGGMLKEAQPVNAEAAVHQGEHAPEIPHEPTHDVTSAQAISCGSGACAPTIQKHLQSDNELDVPTSGSGDGSGVDGKGVVVTTSKYDPPGPGRYGELTVVRKEYELDLREGAFLPTNIEDYRMRILKDGTVRWRRLSGAMADTGNFRFVINESGIYASDIDDELTGYGRFHHGSLVSNSWPTYAGRGYAEEGKIYFLNNNTGHFRQPRSRIGDMFWVFLTNGVDVSYPMDLWYKGRMWLPDPKNPDIPYRDLQTPLKDRSDLSMFKIYNDSDPDRIDNTPGEYRSGVNRMDAPIRNHIDVP